MSTYSWSTGCISALLFSGLYGWWNKQLTTDQGCVTALKHIVKARDEITGGWRIDLVNRPDAVKRRPVPMNLPVIEPAAVRLKMHFRCKHPRRAD